MLKRERPRLRQLSLHITDYPHLVRSKRVTGYRNKNHRIYSMRRKIGNERRCKYRLERE